MDLEFELVELCQEFVDILCVLKEKSLISEEEFIINAKEKLKFIKESRVKIQLQV